MKQFDLTVFGKQQHTTINAIKCKSYWKTILGEIAF